MSVAQSCEQCGASITHGMKVCDNCGAPVGDQTILPVSIAAVIAVVGTFIVIVFVSWVMSGPSDIVVTPIVPVTPMTGVPTTSSTTLPVTTIATPGSGPAHDWNEEGNELHDTKKDYEGALSAYERAIALDPTNAAYWRNKGMTLNSLGRYTEALIAEDKAISLDPNHTTAWNDKSIALSSLGRYSEALIADEKALLLNPDNARYWNSKGVDLAYLNRYSEALIAFDKAIALDPTFQKAIDNKKNLEAKMNN